MSIPELSRRDFQRLSIAALGGVLVGTGSVRAGERAAAEESPLLSDPHVCRGLNTCKGKGQGADNNCAGMGKCATADKHACKGDNACKGQGGCGENPGENACKGKGSCAVPLQDKTWKKARKRFEELMTKAGKQYGPAPAKGS